MAESLCFKLKIALKPPRILSARGENTRAQRVEDIDLADRPSSTPDKPVLPVPPPLSFFAIIEAATRTAVAVGAHGANFIPVPGLDLAFSALSGIIATVDQVEKNKEDCKLLRLRAAAVLQAILSNCEEGADYSQQLVELITLLGDINNSMIAWSKFGVFQRFIRQRTIQKDVKKHIANLESSLAAFGVTSSMKQERLLTKVWELLSGSGSIGPFVDGHPGDIDALSGVSCGLQLYLRQQSPGLERDRTRRDILKVQSVLGGGMANINLGEAECEKVSIHPVERGERYDVFEGKWMGSQKVALKLLRALSGDDGKRRQEKLERLNKQVKIWSLLRNEYVCPIYGLCTSEPDGPYPYLVTPWCSNGMARKYVLHKSRAIRMQLCLEIALGLRYLHNLKPPVGHGCVKGSNVLISNDGKAQLSDFGLSAFDGGQNLTSMASKQPKWLSPENTRGTISPDSDVWAWAMTLLELLSDNDPFFHSKFAPVQIYDEIKKGARPDRNEYAKLNILFSDELWSFLERCWHREPEKRPKIEEVVSTMEAVICEETPEEISASPAVVAEASVPPS
ncbi:hypothetical protein BOTBODRAFT_144306 [Botryobasidium botryosum FD-172 SS1]|uniref:Protein kinase domain-containing protein n=1 Tax=Botryobasidium botryosum (strain FD-172 SS1) TaxID=930990 RepID=A0A067MQH8_BOTB1|nr:hypothetical protein BOTBODRAFT_144306 [Botryobasidium botryosum FD-172 SS1]